MSEENLHKEKNTEKKAEIGRASEHSLDLTINRAKSELSIRNPESGETFTLKVNIEEEEEAALKLRKPLTSDEFQKVFESIDALGLTWTADIWPQLKSKTGGGTDSALTSRELEALTAEYPHFPSELGSVVFYLLAGTKPPAEIVGSDEVLEQKAEFLRKALISPAYRSEFFFKHAIKVPYFADLDWEVVVKTFERGVKESPGIAYALLSLQFRHPVSDPRSRPRPPQNLTVAVNEQLVDQLMRYLYDLKLALQKTQSSFESPKLTESNDAGTKKT